MDMTPKSERFESERIQKLVEMGARAACNLFVF
jgi:hypothetical protein